MYISLKMKFNLYNLQSNNFDMIKLLMVVCYVISLLADFYKRCVINCTEYLELWKKCLTHTHIPL